MGFCLKEPKLVSRNEPTSCPHGGTRQEQSGDAPWDSVLPVGLPRGRGAKQWLLWVLQLLGEAERWCEQLRLFMQHLS